MSRGVVMRVMSEEKLNKLAEFIKQDKVSFADKYYGASEWIAAAVVILLQLKWKNPMVSIIAGTAVYMVLIQKLLV